LYFFFNGELFSNVGVFLRSEKDVLGFPRTSKRLCLGLGTMGLDADAPEVAAFSRLVVLPVDRSDLLTIVTIVIRREKKCGDQNSYRR
jgi:hypothetical protein